MKYKFIIFVILLFASCIKKKVKLKANNDSRSIDSTNDKTIFKINQSSVCYLHLDGNKSQDTTALQLDISGDQVTGKLYSYSMPYQKDARIGTLTGKRVGDTIKVVWNYMQEGMKQTLPVEFLIEKKRMLQKEYSYDSKTGAQVLNPGAKFNREFAAMDCAKFPVRK